MTVSRRNLLITSILGAGAVALHTTLPSCTAATPASGDTDAVPDLPPIQVLTTPQKLDKSALKTEPNILGPYHRTGAPFRGKVTPILTPGQPLLVTGRVWGIDTRTPLPFATVDVWQADAAGRYDNDDPSSPPKPGVYLNRARMITDENGYYEYESVRPGRYQLGPNSWRTSHIHYRVAATGYRALVTQMFFPDDPMNKKDDFIKDSLIAKTQKFKVGKSPVWLSTFDIVLEKI
jgi:protocatechuate 3,4-dioxygenase beta subunit